MAADTPERRPSWPDWFDRRTEGFPLGMPELSGPRFAEQFPFGREGELIRIEESVGDDGLTIRGELPGLDPDEEGRVRPEFRYGSYRRSVTLRPGADVDAITATYDDGILEIRVPVDRGEKEAARIPVGRGG